MDEMALPPDALPSPRASLPGPHDVTRHQLANGLTILVRENWTSQAVVLHGVLRVGSAHDTPASAGLAQFTASLLTRGTTRRSFASIAESVESVGATLGLGSGVFLTTFGGKCLHDDLPMLADILGDVLREPSFPAEHVERVRGQTLNSLRQREASTRVVAYHTFARLIYPHAHPFARPVSGVADTVANLTRDDLAQFYAHHYGPHGGILVVAGAIRTEEALALLEGTLGDWNGVPPPPPSLPPVPALADVRAEIVTLAGKTQSDLVLGAPAIARDHPDYVVMGVMNTILGQMGIGGRLGASVREKAGLAYYVRSTFDAGLGAGPWYAYAGVNPRNLDRAVNLILEQMQRLREAPAEPEELADVQAYLTGSLPLSVETNESAASRILDMELYGLGLDYLYHLPGLINSVTLDDVQAVAARWLRPDAYALAVAGPDVASE